MKKQSKEDYLRAMHNIWTQNNQIINSSELANYLDVSKPAVSKMIRKMQKDGLIKIVPYSKIKFSSKGLKEARKLTYKHRIIEVFLKDILKIDEKRIHAEAHDLEHAFSLDSINRLYKFLNNPKTCPHGQEIKL